MSLDPGSIDTAQQKIAEQIARAAGIRGYSVPGSSVQRHSLPEQISALHMLEELQGVHELGTRYVAIELGRADTP